MKIKHITITLILKDRLTLVWKLITRKIIILDNYDVEVFYTK